MSFVCRRIGSRFVPSVLIVLLATTGLALASGTTRITVTRAPAGSLTCLPPGGDATAAMEIDSALSGNDADNGLDGLDEDANGSQPRINRTVATGAPQGPTVNGRGKAKSNPEVVTTLQGLNFHDQRFANGGNQFSIEPPDQGLCTGAGFVLESTNDVLRVYDSTGVPMTNVVDLNTFYGYPPAINRSASPLRFGPSITDPSCHFDNQTQRWFHTVLTLERANPFTQSLSGANHLDIAVSMTSDPTGGWVVYSIPVQNDGTQGTPDHGCVQRGPGGTLPHGPCLGDYPHIGADANGFYITTNEFDLAGPFFHGAQVYALSKHQLAANAASVNGVLFDTSADPSLQLDGLPGFTVWPAISPGGVFDTANGGTEFFLSSHAVFTGFETRLRVWSMTNTSSLDSASPAPVLATRVANVTGYGIPPSTVQKAGDLPLRDCVADTTTNCFQLVGASSRFNNVPARPPANDSRMQQVSYANGKLWGSLDTGVVFSDNPNTVLAGIAYFVLNPDSLNVHQQGYVAIEGNNVTYPALAVTESGRGAMAFTVIGPDYYPSAGYTSLDAKAGAGDIHVISPGAGPQDGFTGYRPLVSPIRARWGDYGAAATDGNSIWIASESIEQTCTYTQYLVNTPSSPFGTCSNTRGALGNWATRMTKLSVGP